MSLAGLRKQLNKANQFMNEKIGGAEGTKLDKEYVDDEKQVDVMSKLIEESINRIHEYLQPNPATRARLVTMNTFHKLQGKGKNVTYQQPEGLLGDCFYKYGNEISSVSKFGECLVKSGESFKFLADIKYNMEDQVKECYLEPLKSIQLTELKEINLFRKKVEGRRLDYDCKKRKNETIAAGGKALEDEVNIAEQKFYESKQLSEQAMINFLSSDLEHISALAEFILTQVNYHREAIDVMEQLYSFITEKKEECAAQPKPARVPSQIRIASGDYSDTKSEKNGLTSPAGTIGSVKSSGPCCRGLYDFEAENSAELAFAEGDIIQLIQQVDENWFEGTLADKQGYFPVNYVEVITPLP